MVYKDNYTFELNVPPGIYNIILKENAGEYLPYRRASFYVTQGRITELRLSGSEGISQVCNKTLGVVMLPTHTKMSKDQSPLKYDKIPDYKPNNVIVRYCQKKVYANHTLYKFVLFTYDNINIYTDKLTIGKKDFKLKASGRPNSPVWIEVGNCGKEVSSFSLDKNSLENIRNYCISSKSN